MVELFKGIRLIKRSRRWLGTRQFWFNKACSKLSVFQPDFMKLPVSYLTVTSKNSFIVDKTAHELMNVK
jgi:hypothetical protein